jgi:hypothetical protein
MLVTGAAPHTLFRSFSCHALQHITARHTAVKKSVFFVFSLPRPSQWALEVQNEIVLYKLKYINYKNSISINKHILEIY